MIVHLAHNIPQRSIHLNGWEFVSFVKGNFEDSDNRKKIVLLVKRRATKETKMIMIFIDSWKDINFSEQFDLPENIFVVNNSNLIMPQHHSKQISDPYCKYSSDKIMSVYILPREKFKEKMITLII